MPPRSRTAFRFSDSKSLSQWHTRKISIDLSHRITPDKENRGVRFDTYGPSYSKSTCHRSPYPPVTLNPLKGTPTSQSNHTNNDACGLNHMAIEEELHLVLSALDTAKQSMAQYISKESTLTEQVECYRHENKRLFEAIEVKDADLARASVTIEVLMKEVDSLRRDRDRLLEENLGLQTSVGDVTSSLNNTTDILSDKEAHAESYLVEIQQLQEANRRLRFEYSELLDTHRKVAELNLLEQELLLGQAESYREKSDALDEENAILVERLQLTDTMVMDARTTISMLKQANEELDSLYSSAVDATVDLAVRLHVCDDHLSYAMEGMRLQEEKWTSEVAEANLRLQTESSRLKSLVSSETNAKFLVRAELNDLRKEHTSTLAKTDTLRTELEKVELRLKSTHCKLTEAQSTRQALDARIENLNDDLKKARKAGSGLTTNLLKAQCRILALSLQKDDVEKKLDYALEKWKTATCQLIEAEEREQDTIADLESTVGDLLEENENLENRLQKAKQKKQNLRIELEDMKERLEVAEARRRTWRQELNVVQRQLRIAQKHNRSMDQLSVYQFEVHRDLGSNHIKRCKNHSSSTEYSKLVKYVEDINAAIAQYAADLSDKDYFYCTSPPVEESKRTNHILGDSLVSALKKQAVPVKLSKYLTLISLVLEIFMVDWTSAIIDALYPKQRTFADVLVALAAGTLPCSVAGACKTNNRHSIRSESTAVISQCDRGDYSAWAQEALDDLSGILQTCGLVFKNQYEGRFKKRFTSLFKDAYKIRTCMAEKDLCGNLELFVVSSDTLFQTDTMKQSPRMKAEGKQNKENSVVVGTVGLGLEVMEKEPNETVPRSRVILKPTVVITSALNSN